MIFAIDHDDFRDKASGFFFIHAGISDDDDDIADGSHACRSTVQADDAASSFSGNGIRLKARAVIVVADLHAFAGKDACSIEKVSIDRDASHVFKIGFRDGCAVDFSMHHCISHYSASRITLSMSLVLPKRTATARRAFPSIVSGSSARPGISYIST